MIERTFDYRKVKKLARWAPVISREAYYLLESVDGEDLGVWALHEHEDGLMIHAEIGPGCRGKAVVKSAQEAFRWVFEHTACDKIYAGIPVQTRPAWFVASWAGMTFTHEKDKLRYYEYGRNS